MALAELIARADRATVALAELIARADRGDCGALAELTARVVLDNVHRLMLPKLAGPVRLVPLRPLPTAGSRMRP